MMIIKKLTKKQVMVAGGLVIFIFAIFIFGLLAHEVVLEKEDWFDSTVFDFLESISGPTVVKIFTLVTFFGSSHFLLPSYVLLSCILLFIKMKRQAIALMLLGLVSTLLVYFMKFLFARHRPELPLLTPLTDFSFPSGHALSSITFFGALAWLFWQCKVSYAWKWAMLGVLMFIPIAIGISRIVLRYHYASDVVAGLSLGVANFILFLGIWHYRKNRLITR